MFDPELGMEYEYSNEKDKTPNSNNDDEKEKTYSELLNRYWDKIKDILEIIFIDPFKYMIEYDYKKVNTINI